MIGDFLPEYKAVPTPRGYRPSYRLFVGEREKLVPYREGPQHFPTATAAIDAAKEYVRAKLNPTIRAEQAEVVADVLGVDAWHRERAGQAARDQQEAFGTIFVKHKPVKVEIRRVRA